MKNPVKNVDNCTFNIRLCNMKNVVQLAKHLK